MIRTKIGRFEFDSLLAPIIGFDFHGWRIVANCTASIGHGSKFRVRVNRQPGSYQSRLCVYLMSHYFTFWR